MIYKPIFDTIPSEEEKSPDQIYDEVIIYDGGGVKDDNSENN